MNKTLIAVLCLAASGLAMAQAAAPAAPAAAPDREARRAERQARAEARFAETDRNRDGALSLAEWQDARDRKMAEHFQKMDADGNGQLSRDELRRAHVQRRARMAAHRHGRRAQFAHLVALDANGDRALTRAELGDKAPRLSENFERLDADRDGRLTGQELRAGRRAMRDAKRDAAR